MKSEVFNQDCMEAMAQMPDKAFDLAIVDPEYGIDLKGPCGVFERYGTLQSVNSNPPSADYFNELFRVSVRQIIWGGNYFGLPRCQAYIVWDKMHPPGLTFADSEFAWTNADGVARTFRMRPQGDTRIHPTQKPVALYKWLLQNYAKEGDSILDTHLGSGSSRIAAYDLGFDFTGYELDKDYFEAQEARFKNHIAQPKLFEAPQPKQEALFMAA